MPLSEAEMVTILEDLARNGSDTARIQAIKVLIALEAGEKAPADDKFYEGWKPRIKAA